ncbi:PAS/PAC sensor hybrid histidine kinase [Nitrobacter hamburgensis X14]|uniref:histidine kinase n=1 Tax=Nitrobacter hamburgensis (strain DSM 10229 / NCIMB 13809 / X14) TaxID=323097 RepID=Q1QRL2_NITHX|nr:PAS domain-containing protein [Nitrobacter hamburgensis]ABE61135.1 PAS/PAC sensor hybrid histidine kinase [Nitrobacter hamburgensis X14]
MLEKESVGLEAFLAGGGEMADLTRRFDWAGTSVGAPEIWPQSLRTAVRIILNTNHPMLIWWGPDLIQFYNDGFRQTLGPERHPGALGERGRDCWGEVWDIVGPQIEHVMAGRGATWHEDQLVPVTRHGRLEQVYWTYGFSPIDEDHGVGGVLVVCRDVTREHLAKVALQERETELARVQAIGRIGGLEVDLHTGHRSRKSPEYLKIHGLPPEAVNESHEDWLRRVHPDDRAVAEGQFIDAVRGGDREYAVRYRIIRPSDGETRWISARSVIERDADGKAIRLFGAHTDITDQVEAVRAIRQREEEFRALAEALPHHVWTAKPDGELNWCNTRVYDYVGAKPDELVGNDWNKVVHPDDASAAAAAWTHAVATGDPYEIEFRLRGADGSYHWFLARAVPARDEDGRITRWIGTNTDVHDQKLFAGKLAELNATLAERVEEKTRERDRIWNVSQDLLLVTDHDGICRSVNPAWTRTLGWSEAVLLGRTAEWIEHPDDIIKTRVEVRRLARGKATVRFENRLRHKDGSYRWLSWTAVPDQNLIYAVARDITAEKAATERLRAAEEALRQSQKMEAVGQLTGGIAHDFNNLLTGIVGSLDLMQTRLNQGRTDRAGRYIEAAMASANRAAALTHRLLAFARRQPLVPKPVDANHLVLSLEDLLRRTIGEAIDLEIAPSGRLWQTLCDPNQLESALLNLAINARDAMPGGGKLAIATANMTVGAADAGSSAVRPGDYVCITVTDTGTGMTAEVAARAFDPFFTTKPIGQGTGLGLSMIYGFARQSNGHIAFDTAPGRGTSIRLCLPRHDDVAEADQASPANKDRTAATGETVLVVEDEPVVRGVIIEMLHDQGYLTREAADGVAGLRILQLDKPVDLLLTDIGLPGMNGRQLADQARELRPDLKILFMTGYAENAANAEGFLLPGMDMITKPFDLGHLSQRVRDIISG